MAPSKSESPAIVTGCSRIVYTTTSPLRVSGTNRSRTPNGQLWEVSTPSHIPVLDQSREYTNMLVTGPTHSQSSWLGCIYSCNHERASLINCCYRVGVRNMNSLNNLEIGSMSSCRRLAYFLWASYHTTGRPIARYPDWWDPHEKAIAYQSCLRPDTRCGVCW